MIDTETWVRLAGLAARRKPALRRQATASRVYSIRRHQAHRMLTLVLRATQ